MPDEQKHCCTYCAEERPRSELTEGTILFPNIRYDHATGVRRRFVGRKTGLYCKDKGCHGFDQTAHKG